MPVSREPEVLPPPSPELILISVLVQAHLRTMPKKKDRMAFLREVSASLAWQEQFANVIRLRQGPIEADVDKARAAAREWWDRVAGKFESLMVD
jgi:hypothetical protein